jgi:hypothetical protein
VLIPGLENLVPRVYKIDRKAGLYYVLTSAFAE